MSTDVLRRRPPPAATGGRQGGGQGCRQGAGSNLSTRRPACRVVSSGRGTVRRSQQRRHHRCAHRVAAERSDGGADDEIDHAARDRLVDRSDPGALLRDLPARGDDRATAVPRRTRPRLPRVVLRRVRRRIRRWLRPAGRPRRPRESRAAPRARGLRSGTTAADGRRVPTQARSQPDAGAILVPPVSPKENRRSAQLAGTRARPSGGTGRPGGRRRWARPRRQGASRVAGRGSGRSWRRCSGPGARTRCPTGPGRGRVRPVPYDDGSRSSPVTLCRAWALPS
jgi:hypothetical protein